MELIELIKKVKDYTVIGDKTVDVLSLTDNSERTVDKGLFFALKGNNTDGNLFISNAVQNGVVAVVTDTKTDCNVTQVIVNDVRLTMSVISAEFYGNPQDRLKIIGVVGTNGKTTVCHLISSVLRSCGKLVGNVGTLGVKYLGKTVKTDMTTPDPIKFFELLNDMQNSGIEYVVTEYSAHAIYYKKLYPVFFECLVYTNLSEDHLDFFKTMKDYSSVKERAMLSKNVKTVVVNADDELGRKIIFSRDNVYSYGIYNPADVFAVNVNELDGKTEYVINVFDNIAKFSYGLMFEYNVYNTLAVATCCYALGLTVQEIKDGLSEVETITGRAQFVAEYNGGKIYVDFAHTPDGLMKTLQAFRKHCYGKLYSVFGCGGNREKLKRSIMGEISGKYADFTVITSDNPRYEDANSIIKDIENGIRKVSRDYITIPDRFEGIKYAISKIGIDDVLVVAGKGGETTQEVMGVFHDFSDEKVIIEIINNKEV